METAGKIHDIVAEFFLERNGGDGSAVPDSGGGLCAGGEAGEGGEDPASYGGAGDRGGEGDGGEEGSGIVPVNEG